MACLLNLMLPSVCLVVFLFCFFFVGVIELLLLLLLFYFGLVFALFLFVFWFLFFRDRVSLCIPGCPGTHSIDQADLELRNLPPKYWN